MDGAGEELLARTGLAREQDRARAGRDGGKHAEKRMHAGAAAVEFAHVHAAFKLALERVYFGQIAKGLGAAHDPSALVAKDRRGHADGDALPLGGDDVAARADMRPAAGQGGLQRAVLAAQAGAEDFGAKTAQGFGARNPVISSAARLKDVMRH
jgi:hypothetical protein